MSSISFILHKPQLSENIGACARAIKNFNFSKLVVINPAKIMSMVTIDLLANKSSKAFSIMNDFKPLLSREKYLDLQYSRFRTEVYPVIG